METVWLQAVIERIEIEQTRAKRRRISGLRTGGYPRRLQDAHSSGKGASMTCPSTSIRWLCSHIV